jgi:hypothetical protein
VASPMVFPGFPSIGRAALLAVTLTAALALLLCAAGTASAGPLVGRDGKIHACYKFKGKAKGTLRVVRSAKVRCPRRWKKVAWYASGPAGPRGETGGQGQTGARGEAGAPGTAGNVVVAGLEDKVTELLAKVQSLENVATSLCAQTKALNEQTTALGTSTTALNTLLDTLLITFTPVSVPTALSPFTCPAL